MKTYIKFRLWSQAVVTGHGSLGKVSYQERQKWFISGTVVV